MTVQLPGIALLGAGWISRVYVAALQRAGGASLAAVASRTRAAAERLTQGFASAQAYAFDELPLLLADPNLRLVCVNSPNRLHAEHALAALEAGKDVVVEKPLCLTLEEADSLCASAARHGRVLGYAENLCFAPLYRRARELVREGAVGRVLWARQVEKHGGPYSPWFFDRAEAGGGALMDMGCHGIEALRFVFDRPAIRAVSARLATVLHSEKTRLEDDAVVRLELAGGATLISESSWAVQSGMQSTLEVHGNEGTLSVDLMGETGLRLAKRGGGVTRPTVDPLLEHGYVGELAHFIACAGGAAAEETGEDGRAVLEILLAAYASAGQGGCEIALPFRPAGVSRPVDLWSR
ncbi:MAG: Gfo/Idh/MocA family protein [Myxococcota bacterium]